MGMFDSSTAFTTYHCELDFREKIMGGVPKDPKVIEGWIRSKMGLTVGDEIRRKMIETMIENGVEEINQDSSDAELVKASEQLANRSAVGFKRDANGLYIEGRQVKALIKECTNILFAGEKWLATRKGPRNVSAERIFPWQDRIYLGRQEPDDVETMTGRIVGAGGPRSILSYHEYVIRPKIQFDLMVCQDALLPAQWEMLWVHAQENGLGAMRSQGHGRFDIWTFEPIPTPQNRIRDLVSDEVMEQLMANPAEVLVAV